MNDRYKAFPQHPLHAVPEEILVAARDFLLDAAEIGDVDMDMAIPLADGMVLTLLPWLKL